MEQNGNKPDANGVPPVMNVVHRLILRAPNGEERRTLVWLPTEAVRKDYYEKARKRGLTIEEEC